jgi:sugar phosphate isomerase/epimerase
MLKSTAALALGSAQAKPAEPAPTKFQIGCMTITYSAFPFERALEGIAAAGYKYAGWGTTHKDASGRTAPVIAADAPVEEARRLAQLSRDHGLEPVMMFSEIYVAAPDSVKVHTRRIEQASAAGIPFIITFGKIEKSGPGDLGTWVRNLKQLGPLARNAGVTLVVKQHGGETATGRDCSRIIGEVADDGVKMCYDAGNVLDYENADPIPDIQACWRDVRAFAIKDHRNTPKDEDCGPGFGEIDHYKLLAPVLRTGLTIPLVCENIFEPLVPRPRTPEGVDRLAQRAREFLETVTRGLAATA